MASYESLSRLSRVGFGEYNQAVPGQLCQISHTSTLAERCSMRAGKVAKGKCRPRVSREIKSVFEWFLALGCRYRAARGSASFVTQLTHD
jgi:hypothetical protein